MTDDNVVKLEWMKEDHCAARPLDVSAGDARRVTLSLPTAILLAEAFCDMANAKRLYVASLEGAENITRAFGELDLLQKAIGGE